MKVEVNNLVSEVLKYSEYILIAFLNVVIVKRRCVLRVIRTVTLYLSLDFDNLHSIPM